VEDELVKQNLRDRLYVWYVQQGQQLSQIHPSDAKRLCDSVEQSLHVIDGNVHSLQAGVNELREAKHSHTDTLQHRFTYVDVVL